MSVVALWIAFVILAICFCLLAYLINRAVNEAVDRMSKAEQDNRTRLKEEIKTEVLKELSKN